MAYLYYTKEHNIKMENKLNFSAIESYAQTYSNKICDRIYTGKTMVNGKDLLDLPVQQVGLFVLYEIYHTWQSEAKNLRSPYFDYEAEDVTQALNKLMNVLSKNIAVNRDNLEPLLTQAVHDVILIAISPYSYFKKLLGKISDAAEFAEINKFIKINSGLASEIHSTLENNGPQSLAEQFDNIFDQIEISPDHVGPVFSKLSEVHPASESSFFLAMETDEDEDDESAPLSKTENTLNDSFVSSDYETVADQLKNTQSSKGSIKSMLSINQKFMFINDLFNDNQEDFNKVVDFIESCDTREAAISFINNNYLKHHIWNPNAPQVREFLRLIDLQFE